MQTEVPVTILKPNPNLDPITGAPGSHPVATATGAVLISAACAALGAAAGPLGIAVGGAAGAIAGGLTGSAVGESMDPTVADIPGEKEESPRAKRPHPYGKYIHTYKADFESTQPPATADEITPAPRSPDR